MKSILSVLGILAVFSSTACTDDAGTLNSEEENPESATENAITVKVVCERYHLRCADGDAEDCVHVVLRKDTIEKCGTESLSCENFDDNDEDTGHVCGFANTSALRRSCNEPEDCVSGVCEDGACGPMLAAGDECEVEAQCLSNRCFDGKCGQIDGGVPYEGITESLQIGSCGWVETTSEDVESCTEATNPCSDACEACEEEGENCKECEECRAYPFEACVYGGVPPNCEEKVPAAMPVDPPAESEDPEEPEEPVSYKLVTLDLDVMPWVVHERYGAYAPDSFLDVRDISTKLSRSDGELPVQNEIWYGQSTQVGVTRTQPVTATDNPPAWAEPQIWTTSESMGAVERIAMAYDGGWVATTAKVWAVTDQGFPMNAEPLASHGGLNDFVAGPFNPALLHQNTVSLAPGNGQPYSDDPLKLDTSSIHCVEVEEVTRCGPCLDGATGCLEFAGVGVALAIDSSANITYTLAEDDEHYAVFNGAGEILFGGKGSAEAIAERNGNIAVAHDGGVTFWDGARARDIQFLELSAITHLVYLSGQVVAIGQHTSGTVGLQGYDPSLFANTQALTLPASAMEGVTEVVRALGSQSMFPELDRPAVTLLMK